MAATAVTPVGVRDGDPDALAGLCDRRGPAVLAYCAVVAGRGEIATVAAADAFGSFRAGVVAAPDLANLNPEALLISATRHAAARYAGVDAPEPHARVPALLAARADRSITLADHDWLEEHLETCWTCRAPVARFEAADRAYRDPPKSRMDPQISAAILAALVAAAPVLGAPEEPPAVADPSPNGAAPASEQAVPEPEGHADQPTAAWQAGADDHGQLAETPAEAPAPQPDRAARRTVKIGGLSRRPRDASVPTTASLRAEAEAEPRSGRGAQLPRPSRAAIEAGEGRRSRPPLRRGLVLPIVLVVLAIVIGLLIAGVFGGNEPASAPQSFAPDSSTPTDTTPAPVVVVPGAAAATAAAVEAAKAKTRAARRRAEQARKAAASSAATSATAGSTPPVAPPPAAATRDDGAAVPTQKRAPAGDRDAEPKIDAGDGATGAEELPSEDTSDIPELAPPAESADPPGR